MAQRVVLHIGTMKSGTSYVQGQLFAQRRHLARRGVLVPGASRSHQIEALQQGRAKRRDRSTWTAMAAKIRTHPGDVVLSHELLGAGGAKVLRNLLPDLEPAVVDVVITVRDLNRTLVSMWQETIQNGRTWTWDSYYASARDAAPYARTGAVDPDSAGGRFWKQQDVVRIAEMWADRLGPERIAVIAVPPRSADRTLLPARFVEATGVPLDPSAPSPRANESLGLASVLALREVNELLETLGHPWPSGGQLRKRLLAKKVLAARADQEPRLALDPPDWVREQTTATVEGLKATGVRYVGNWSDLDPIVVPGIRPEDADPRLVSSAAIAGLAGVIAAQIEKEPPDQAPAPM